MRYVIRIGIAALLLLGLLAQTPIPIALYGFATRFYAPLNVSGFPAVNLTTSWPVSGVPAPTVSWDARDPTGASITSHAFTATGSTESGTAPFNRTGDFATPSGGMEYRRFDGANDYYSHTATPAVLDISDGVDATICTVYRSDTANDYIAGAVDAPTNQGWWIQTGASNVPTCHVTTAGGAFSRAGASVGRGWSLLCCLIDNGVNLYAWTNGTISAATAWTAGAITAADEITVGTREPDQVATSMAGDEALVVAWRSLLTDSQLDLVLGYLTGKLDSMGAALVTSNTGPYCMCFAGKLECFGDDFGPVVGGEMCPGATGAGNPATAAYVANSVTDSILQGDALGTTWSQQGDVVVCTNGAAATSPYADGRMVSRCVDDDGADWEYVQQGVAVTNLGVGDKVQLCLWARDDANTTIDVQMTEITGAGGDGCTTKTTNYATTTISTTWTRYCYEATMTDIDCELMYAKIAPVVDVSAAAGTGTADIGAVAMYTANNAAGGQSWIPPFHVPTTTAAVTAGSDLIAYTITGRGIVDAAGAIVGTVEMSMGFAPAVGDTLSNSAFLIYLGSAGAEYLSLLHLAAETIRLTDGTPHGVTGAYNTVGTLATVKGSANYGSDQYWIELDGTRTTDATADTSPTGITTLRIGANGATATLMTGGFFINQVKVRR